MKIVCIINGRTFTLSVDEFLKRLFKNPFDTALQVKEVLK